MACMHAPPHHRSIQPCIHTICYKAWLLPSTASYQTCTAVRLFRSNLWGVRKPYAPACPHLRVLHHCAQLGSLEAPSCTASGFHKYATLHAAPYKTVFISTFDALHVIKYPKIRICEATHHDHVSPRACPRAMSFGQHHSYASTGVECRARET